MNEFINLVVKSLEKMAVDLAGLKMTKPYKTFVGEIPVVIEAAEVGAQMTVGDKDAPIIILGKDAGASYDVRIFDVVAALASKWETILSEAQKCAEDDRADEKTETLRAFLAGEAVPEYELPASENNDDDEYDECIDDDGIDNADTEDDIPSFIVDAVINARKHRYSDFIDNHNDAALRCARTSVAKTLVKKTGINILELGVPVERIDEIIANVVGDERIFNPDGSIAND